MKRLIASAGLAALGAASLQAAYTPGLTPLETSKPWSVSVAVRGFYDDNYTTQVDELAQESFGVSINPTAAVNFALETTLISIRYDYDMRWYEDRSSNEADHIQQFSLGIQHAFSERTKLDISERFIYGQEGSVYLDGPVTTPTVLQTDSDYSRNIAKVGLEFGVSEKVGLALRYKNEIWDWENAGDYSRSAYLDTMLNLITLEGMIGLSGPTDALLGYQYGMLGYTRNYLISLDVGLDVPSEARDANSHYIYAGLEHDFNPQLKGSIRAGVQITDYTNLQDYAPGYDDSDLVPYVDARLTWTYNPGSTLELGVMNTLSSTDVSALDASALAAWLGVNHRITPRWSVGANGLFQYSQFNQGAYDGNNEMLVLAGVNTTYQFNPNLSAEGGYNFDLLDSDIPRDYDRNRFFIGLRATF